MNMTGPSRFSLGRLTIIDMLLIAFGIYWLCMLPPLFSDTPVSPASTRVLLLPAVCLLYWAIVQRMNQAARATSVLGNLLSPGTLWQQLNAEGLQRVRLIWALLATGTTLQLALPGSTTQALAGAALMSLAGTVALLHCVARAGGLPIGARTVDMAVLALAVPVLLFRPQAAFEWFAALPFGVLAATVVAFPLLLSILEYRWRRRAPVYRWCEPQRRLTMVDAALTHLRRYTVLMYNPNSETMGWTSKRQVSNPFRLFFTIMPLFMGLTSKSHAFSDGQLSVSSLTGGMIMVLFMASGLVVRDLHWRTFLMPGGMQKGRIGSSIFATTILIQFGALALALIAMAIWIRAGMGLEMDALYRIVEAHATLPLEVALATAVAVAFRPLSKSPIWLVLFIVGAIIASLVLIGQTGTGYLPISATSYAGVMVGATIVCVLISNRMWTMQRLFEISGLDKPDQ